MAPGAAPAQDRQMRSAPTRLAIVLTVYATIVLLAAAAISVRSNIHGGPSPHWAAFIEIALGLSFGPIAVVIVSREPRNPIPWLLLFFACVASTQLVVSYIAQSMVADGTSGANWVAWVASWMISPAFGSLYTLLLQLFPTGARRRRASARCCYATIATLVLAVFLQPLAGDKLDPYTTVDNPVGLLPVWTNGILVICEAIILCLSIASLVVRFRRASGLERLQLGWYVLWAILTALTFVSGLAVYAFSSYVGEGLFAISTGMVLALPAVAGIAMIRHRLYDVDLVLNRTLVYGALSACVIGAYAALVFGVGAIASGQGTLVAAGAAADLRARGRTASKPLAARRQPPAVRRARRADRRRQRARTAPRVDDRAERRAADARRRGGARTATSLRRGRARHDGRVRARRPRGRAARPPARDLAAQPGRDRRPPAALAAPRR